MQNLFNNIIIIKVIILLTFSSLSKSIYITIETGFVGVEHVWNKILGPRLQFFLSHHIQYYHCGNKTQKDSIQNVECVINDGHKLIFDSIEVGNILSAQYVINTISCFGLNYDHYLETDLVRHQINVICSKKSAY